MRTSLQIALAATLSLGALAAGGATAAPVLGAGASGAIDFDGGVEQARVVCDQWGRCWRTRPRYYRPPPPPPPGMWGPPPRRWGPPPPGAWGRPPRW